MNPFTEGALALAKQGHESLRNAIQKADAQALNWQPAPDTTSPYALVVHALGSERWWIARAVGQEVQRDRNAELAARGDDPAELLRLIDQTEADITAYLSQLEAEELGRPVQILNQQMPAAQAVIRPLLHLREHLGHLELTLQMWQQQQASGARPK